MQQESLEQRNGLKIRTWGGGRASRLVFRDSWSPGEVSGSTTGRVQLIRSLSLAGCCFELSGNSNYIQLQSIVLVFDV